MPSTQPCLDEWAQDEAIFATPGSGSIQLALLSKNTCLLEQTLLSVWHEEQTADALYCAETFTVVNLVS